MIGTDQDRPAEVRVGDSRKFAPDGEARRFRGNTFVCHIPQDSSFFATEARILQDFAQTRFSSDFAVLPLNSMHMTVFEGVLEYHRGTPLWPDDLPDDMPIEEVSLVLSQKLRRAAFDQHGHESDQHGHESGLENDHQDGQLSMRVTGLKDLRRSFGVGLEPADAQTADRLKALRTQISQVTAISHDDPDTYAFHSSLGYRLRPPSPADEPRLMELRSRYEQWLVEDAPTVSLGPCEFNIHDDMLSFPVLQFLS